MMGIVIDSMTLINEITIAHIEILLARLAALADSFVASADASALLTARSFNSSLFLSFSKFSCSLTKPTKAVQHKKYDGREKKFGHGSVISNYL